MLERAYQYLFPKRLSPVLTHTNTALDLSLHL